jgi:hypothetical protein
VQAEPREPSRPGFSPHPKHIWGLALALCVIAASSIPSLSRSAEAPPDTLCMPPYSNLTLPTVASPWSVVMTDLNDDGMTDIIAACEDSSLSVLLGAGNGRFQAHVDYPVGRKPPNDVSVRRLSACDINADGYVDVAVTDAEASTVTTMLGVGDGTFVSRRDTPVGAGPSGIAIADFNRDGLDDIVTANAYGSSLTFLLSQGVGPPNSLQYILASAMPVSLSAGDFNGDGYADVVVGTVQHWSGNFLIRGTLSLLLGNGDGSFQPRITLDEEGSWPAIATADLDTDGVLDLVTGNDVAIAVEVRLGLGDGQFEEPVTLGVGNANAIAVGDLNNDGRKDLALGSVTVLLGRGDGTFDLGGSEPLGYFSTSTALGDINQDGRIDIASTYTSAVVVLLNRWVDPPPYPALAFPVLPQQPIVVTSPELEVSFHVQPADEAFRIEDIGTETISLASGGTGRRDRIYALRSSTAEPWDSNGDGIAEITVWFSGEDLGDLFSEIRGKRRVEAWLSACLPGGDIRSRMELDVVGNTRRGCAAALQGSGRLRVESTKAGWVVLSLYDVHGRAVRRLTHEVSPSVPVVIECSNVEKGQRLTSGVYFYRVEAPEGACTGRLVMLR